MRILTRIFTMLRVGCRRDKQAAALVAVCLTCLFGGCSVFELRDPDAPSPGDGPDDPMNITDIIRAVKPSVITGMNYEYYFTDTVEFQDYRLVTIRGRDVIQMLERLRSRSPQSLRVDWQITNKWPEGNLYYLDNVKYVIYSSGAPIHSGTAYFRILDDKISYWKDVPDGAPFFEQ